MTNSRRPSPFLWPGLALLALAGCETREIAENPVTHVDADPGPDRGGLMIVFAPSEATFEENQARAFSNPNFTPYHLFMDGSQLAFADVDAHGTPWPITMSEGGAFGAGYVAAGMHHFEIAVAGGGATIFAGDADIRAGSMTRLYLFGPSGAVQGRFVSHPELPPPGTLHVSATNLVRGGAGIEVVRCESDTDCVPLSPPLALGETFAADFAAVVPEPTDPSASSRLAGGEGFGYRAVPTAAVPAPPTQAFLRGTTLSGSIRTPPANFVAAPIYLAADGQVLAFHN